MINYYNFTVSYRCSIYLYFRYCKQQKNPQRQTTGNDGASLFSDHHEIALNSINNIVAHQNHTNSNNASNAYVSHDQSTINTSNEQNFACNSLFEACSGSSIQYMNIDDHYAESEDGQYNIAGSSRLRIKEVVYDHSVNCMYDSALQGTQLGEVDFTYDHTFGTEDDYDITES